MDKNNLLKKNSLKKWLLAYFLIILSGYFLFPAAWGGVNGLLVAAKIATVPSFQAEMMEFIGEQPTEKDFWKKLPVEKKRKIEGIVKERFKSINWLPIHLIANLITFSFLGFIIGIILRDFVFSGIIPLILLFITVPVLTAPDFVVHSISVTIIIWLTTQIISVYLFSYLGYRIKERNLRKENNENV